MGLSIVIPNWNHEFVLPRSIQSALKAVEILQGHQVESEVWVIDDQSRDGSPVLLRQLEALYFERGLRVTLMPQNAGVVEVRNYALRNARHPYILFMDADNQLFFENVHIFYRAILETQAAVVYGNVVRYGQGYIELWNNESFQPRIFHENYLDTFAVYDRMQVLDAGGTIFNESIYGLEDWELYLHLAANGRKIVFVPVMFGIYYELPASRIKVARTPEAIQKRQAYFERVYDQLGIRLQQNFNTHHLRYHPDIGYL